MSKRKIIECENFDKAALDLSTWPTVRTESLQEKHQETFLKRKKAIYMYFENQTHKEVEEETGISRKQLNTLLKKCLQYDDNGVIWGFRALIPYKRIDSYDRQSLPKSQGENNNGAFHLLLNTYPVLKDTIDELFFRHKNKSAADPNTRTNYIHRRFIKKCREIGIKPPHYPFNTKELGRRSLYKYVKQLETGKISNLGDQYYQENKNPPPMITRPFERVQFDGHKIDLALAIVINTPEGGEIVKEINRIWILTLMDVATRNILGYHISLNKEYNSSDVLRCIRNSIVPWKRKEFTIPGISYPEEGGFPSGVIPETQWAIWDELFYDNARANLSSIVRDRLKKVVGCNINAGQVKSPLRRSMKERFYGILEENGFHRLPNTTGSNPNDSRRKNAEKNAIKYRITPDQIEELTEVLIADYNGTPHEGISFHTPIEAMREKIANNPLIINQISPEKRSEVAFLTLHAQRTINGSFKDKRRPYIEYENVRYSNPLLARSYGLIGKKLDLVINTDDLRVIRAYLPDGSELGILKASGKWALTPHSLQVRKEIFKLRHKKLLNFTFKEDPIEIYHRYLKESSKTNKRDRNKLGSLEKSLSEVIKQEENASENIDERSNNETNTHNQVIPRKIRKKPVDTGNKKIRKTIFY
ncbi:MAG: hypothetical protein LPK26_01730 [Bacillaceae bacterium]|nr:hypothetical protein [Bacillaceae bacterium]